MVCERQVELIFLKLNQSQLWLSESNVKNMLVYINDHEHGYLPGKHIEYRLCIEYEKTFSRKIVKQIITLSSLENVFVARQIVLLFVLVDELCRSPYSALNRFPVRGCPCTVCHKSFATFFVLHLSLFRNMKKCWSSFHKMRRRILYKVLFALI